MDRETFKRKVEQILYKIDMGQKKYFLWRCAVRALPFISSNGNFNFWPESTRQKYLYAIFNALDYAAMLADSYKVANAEAIRDAAIAAALDAPYASVANASKAAAYSVDYALKAESDSLDSVIYGVFDAFTLNNIDLTHVILEDLRAVQTKKKIPKYNCIMQYGVVWKRFKRTLNAEGCSYWEGLYKNIFDNGMVLEREILEKRMSVPAEIREQGAAAVAVYLEALLKGSTRLNEARIVILGDKGVGKTCIARRIIDPKAPMTTDDESTAGVNMLLWKLNEDYMNVRIWDFAGHTVTHAVHQFFLSERCLYLVIYDGRTEKRNRLRYWLDHMKNYGGDSQAIILINERDQFSVDLPVNSLKELYSIAGVYNFSIKDDIVKLEAFRKDVAEYINNNPSWKRQEIPINYYEVKDELENLFEKGNAEQGREHISKKEFQVIANKKQVADSEELLKALHYLGVSLWYKDMEEFDTLVLNPEWISQGVYQIINWVNGLERHSLSLPEFQKVFQRNSKRYPYNKHRFLFKLMKHYELAYETEDGQSLIIPHLLKEDRPEQLPAFHMEDSLMLRYKSELPLPPNTISRFIVRHNQEIKGNIEWRYGVLLEDNKGNIALVREKDRTISVSVRGPDRTKYISELRSTLNDIFKSYKSNKPELQYRVERFGLINDEVEAKYPLWLPDRKILNQSNDNVPYYEDISKKHIDLNYTVKIYDITAENLMLDGIENQLIAKKSVHNTFNFYNWNIGLQGNLNELTQLLIESDQNEEVRELKNIVKFLEQSESLKSKQEVKKKGIANRIKRFLENLGDENSKLHKTIKGAKNGISIVQDISKGYNDIAQWVGLPQIPKIFLKK